MAQHNSKIEDVVANGNDFPQTKTVSSENGRVVESQDKDVVSEGSGSISVYDQWVAPPVSGQRPKPRYEVLAYHRGLLFEKFLFYTLVLRGLLLEVGLLLSLC